MILGKIEGVEVVALGLRLRTDGAREPQLAEDVADLVDDLRDDVDAAAPLGPAGQREIDVGERGGTALELALAVFDRLLELALQRVRLTADAFAGLGVEAR